MIFLDKSLLDLSTEGLLVNSCRMPNACCYEG